MTIHQLQAHDVFACLALMRTATCSDIRSLFRLFCVFASRGASSESMASISLSRNSESLGRVLEAAIVAVLTVAVEINRPVGVLALIAGGIVKNEVDGAETGEGLAA